MTLAFLLSPYTDAPHVRRLIEALPEGSHFFVHVDRKCDMQPFREALAGLPRVHLLEQRVEVTWGSLRQVEYQMALIRAALAEGTPFDYLVTMSGQDYPVWSNRRITDYFTRLDGRIPLQGICMEGQGESARLYRQYWPLNNYAWTRGSMASRLRVALRKTLKALHLSKPLTFTSNGQQYRLYKGSDWHALTPQLAAYVLKKWEEEPAFRRYFRNSFTPSETFIHTVAFQSPFADRCQLATGAYESLARLTPLTYIDYRSDIKILTTDDLPLIHQSGKMFCRKTVSGTSDSLMDELDRLRNEEQ